MYIESIRLNNFRNYESLEMNFDQGTNILYGDNAQGKTNILEAVYLAGTSKSHKGSKDREMIRFENEESHIRMMVKKGDLSYKIDMHLRKNKANRAQDELNNGTRPPLSSHIDQEVMEQYDVIFVGFPIWWYDLPMPVWSFLEEYDLSGKTIIPFFTHNGSSSGASSISTVAELCPDSTVLTDDYFTYSGNNVDEAESAVDEWLTELGYNN